MVLSISTLLFLSFNLNANAEFKFHSKFVIKDSDLFNEPSDKRLIVFGQGGRLFL